MVFATLRAAVAVPPVPLAGVKLSSVIPGAAALVILAPVTVPSASLALTFADVALPCTVLREPGHEGMIGTTHRFVGDAVLRGKVLTVEAVPLLFTSTPATASTPAATRATTMLVTMKCEVTLTEATTEKVLYHNDNFLFREPYEVSTDVASFFEEQDPALDRMARDFASRLVAALLEGL